MTSVDYEITDGYSSCKSGSSSSALVDLMGLNASANAAPSNPEPSSLQTLTQNVGISLLDDELMSLGKHKKTHVACKHKGRLLSLTFLTSQRCLHSSVCTPYFHWPACSPPVG